MSDQNMTRRDAVRLGGTALAAAGLSAGVSAAGPADPVPAKGGSDNAMSSKKNDNTILQ